MHSHKNFLMMSPAVTVPVLFLAAVFYCTGCKKEPALQQHARPELVITASDTARLRSASIHFFKDTVYILATDLTRDSGQTLQIDAGVICKVNDRLSIIINPGARIEARGTAADPIIFTSSAPAGSAGPIGSSSTTGEHAWHGIRIYGNYPNQDNIDNTPAGTGILSYVRIEFAGTSNDNFTAFPALLLQNIGKGTQIDHIQVSYSVDYNSFGIYNGDFNASNLVSFASGGTDFYITDGYKGMLQHLLASRHPYFPTQNPTAPPVQGLAGVFIEGAGTLPAISNLSVIGPDLQQGTNSIYSDTISAGLFGNLNGHRVASLVTRGGCKFHIRNSIFLGFPKGGWYLDDNATAQWVADGSSDLSYCILHSNDSSRVFYLPAGVYPGAGSPQFKDFELQSQFGNEVFGNSGQFMLADPFNFFGVLNFQPRTGSPLLNKANFDIAPFTDPFFQKGSYRGALGTDNWLQGWTNFIPAQTNYNN